MIGAKLAAEDVRGIALSLLQTEERERWNHPMYDVARRMFVTVPDDQTSFAVRFPSTIAPS